MKKLFGCLIFFGSVLLLGTAGASDAGTIDSSQMWLQISIAATMIGSGYIAIKVIDKIKAEKKQKKNAPSRPIPEAFIVDRTSTIATTPSLYTKRKDCQYGIIATTTNQFSRN